ncbi:hypothetical protein D3C85_1500130 [compost metagenome]
MTWNIRLKLAFTASASCELLYFVTKGTTFRSSYCSCTTYAFSCAMYCVFSLSGSDNAANTPFAASSASTLESNFSVSAKKVSPAILTLTRYCSSYCSTTKLQRLCNCLSSIPAKYLASSSKPEMLLLFHLFLK